MNGHGPTLDVDVVVPTIGRPSLSRLLASLAEAAAAGSRWPRSILLVDDRRDRSSPLLADGLGDPWLRDRVRVVEGRALGPAAARNDGWRRATATWVAFLDDDVVVADDWFSALDADLWDLDAGVAGSEGRIHVPLPRDRRPTDWERNVAGLESARWATADMAFRRRALAAVGGFDERFPRAYREDADLGLRLTGAGWRIVAGRRLVLHPVPPAPWWVSVAKQAGNADDALMTRVHGRGWRERAGAPAGRRRRHLATTAALAVGLVAAAAGRRRTAVVAGAAWAGLTGELTWTRLREGPRSAAETARMAATSLVMPVVATTWWLRGQVRARQLAPAEATPRVEAILFDRDGTLVLDVPYNGDPELVRPVDGAGEALARVRRAGMRTGIVSNQSGVARGRIDHGQVHAVNARVQQLLGSFDVVSWCPHDEADGCRCRKPAPGLVVDAAEALGIRPERIAVVGDIGADVEAARAAGAHGVLVPTEATAFEEVASCPVVFADLDAAVTHLLRGASVP